MNNTFVEARQSLGKALYRALKKHGKVCAKLEFNTFIYFYTRFDNLCVEYGFRYFDGDGLMAVRQTTDGPHDAVSLRTKEPHLKLALKYMPAVEAFLDALGTE